MIAMRYGTPPIVRRTGGLADSVVDELARPGEGTGFAFAAATSDALAEACEAAIVMREVGGPAWAGLVARGMATDFDWTTGSAPRYAETYRRAVEIRRA
jgi:starch synthase